MKDRNVKRLRQELGLSQERFARLLGVSLQTVRRWESGISRPLPIISLKLEELERQTRANRPGVGGVSMSKGARAPTESIEIGLGGLFKGIGGLFGLVAKLAEEGKEEYSRTGEVEVLGGKGKAVYGFTVKLGLGGKPVIEQFGNIQTTEGGPVVAEVRDPLVDVLDEGDSVVVIVELPGVEAADIHIEVKEDILDLTAETGDRKYAKEILLPSPVDASTMKSSYNNGILEIRVGKKR